MTPERQKIIDRIKHISEAGIILSFVLVIVLQLIPSIWNVEIPKAVDSAIVKVLISLFFLSFAALLISSFWATDDKREQDKADMKEILQEIKAEEASKPKRTIFKPEEIKVPLKGLTPQQVSVVHDILQHIPEQNGHLKTSELVQILRALQGQGDLDDSNMPQVIAWVEYVTEKKVDERNFNYDYHNKVSDKGVVKWGDIIRAKFDKIEIS